MGLLDFLGNITGGAVEDKNKNAVSAPTYDWTGYNQAQQQGQGSRLTQQQLVQMLQGQAAGNGPSIAQTQLAQNTAANQQQQQAMAASARGGAGAQQAAQRQALYQGAQTQQQAVGQAATTRAQEQLGATAQLGQATGQLRQGDLASQQTAAQQQLGIGEQYNQFQATQEKNANDEANSNTGMLQKFWTGSDERIKKDIQPADHDIRSFLDALHAKRYEYRDPGEPGQTPGEHYGVIAQDAERSKVGRTIVDEGPDGHKGFDVRNAFSALLASTADLHARLNALEGRRR